MGRESTVFGLAPHRVKRLFDIGQDAESSEQKLSSIEKRAETLRKRLADTLPLDESEIRMLPAVLGQLCQSIGLLAGEPIHLLLQNPATDIALIERIKQHGKELSSRAENRTEREVATTIYYAAIANALVYHDVRISKLPYETLSMSFSRLAKEEWVSHDLSTLFRSADKRCEEEA